MEKEIVISIKKLIIKFKTRANVLTAIRNISFDIYDGETLAIVGESGSGKSVMTKTFTNMLESNGWISNGSIVYSPSKNILADDFAYFRKPVHLVDFHKILLDNSLQKNIIKYNKKRIIRTTQKIKMINSLELTNLQAAIVALRNKIEVLKKQIGFSHSNRINNKIGKLNAQLKEYKNQQEMLLNPELKQKKIEFLQSWIIDYNNEIDKIKKLTWREKRLLGKNIQFLKKYFEQGIIPPPTEFSKIQNYFSKKTYTDGIRYRINKLNQLMVIGEPLNANNFTNVYEEWNLIKNFEFINKLKAAKQISKLRGPTIATIFQDPMISLNPLLSVGFQISEVLRKHRKLSRAMAKKTALELLEKVGIPKAKKRYHDIPGMYSGGMRQRVVIAIALACQPKVLICDEPTTALDVTIQAQILDLIKSLQKEYKFTVIFITHDLGVVANIADRVAVMYAGQIIEYGTVNDIFFDPKHPYTWALLSSLPQFGQKGEDLYSIPGSPPSLFAKVYGDPFAPRNQYAMKIDYLLEPPMFKVSETHYAKTWLLDPRAAKVTKPKQLQQLEQIKNDTKVGD
ncbi:oligopeptide ABC transporter ATP-binding protein OppD [Spiroplasma citri]|uniref:ATP-binding cassette domain-containing protein n=2 Tax=Spiroplasma citri TaxID=2133 RepID=A0AAJ4JY12_SPICI|nr:oligopeptide ABC transporter ATP-binding protein OppD [Spiroplasma citri]APE74596.1 oligopeptide ABC transporter ATP-binding protein [Spiroplasma citri]QIA66796.1 ATP-binding cassette domain-containing protein [Spiroplasma citri]QIA68668.1 ATP-binding cassette domain-containing protein [Spiroplasma citri]QIA73867.1 ATP-binding cassette domain-containing protein [Spiroplasma citri]QIA74797.1 ATP-binding cassette domain-containing protein [Spiroplasma citri]